MRFREINNRCVRDAKRDASKNSRMDIIYRTCLLDGKYNNRACARKDRFNQKKSEGGP
jgi:hypothetical protein